MLRGDEVIASYQSSQRITHVHPLGSRVLVRWEEINAAMFNGFYILQANLQGNSWFSSWRTEEGEACQSYQQAMTFWDPIMVKEVSNTHLKKSKPQ